MTRTAEFFSVRKVEQKAYLSCSALEVLNRRAESTAPSCSAQRVISLGDGFEIYRRF